MQALILNGFPTGDPRESALRPAIISALKAAGLTAQRLDLDTMQIRPCSGDFHCWIRTPGECQYDDDGRTVARAVVQSDLLLFLTPVTFGGYSAILKTALDRLIPAISPFFARVAGETHHHRRYPKRPVLVAIGTLPAPDPEEEAIFRTLAGRNALNMRSRAHGAAVLHDTMASAEMEQRVAAALAAVGVSA